MTETVHPGELASEVELPIALLKQLQPGDVGLDEQLDLVGKGWLESGQDALPRGHEK